MELFVAFALTLMVAVLVSGRAHRSILSTAVVFLAAGFLIGDGGFGWLHISPTDPLVIDLAEVALFAVLFTDGMHATRAQLANVWHLPGRALTIGLPVTFALGALAAHWLVGLGWVEAMLLSAVLAPTDPVFAEAIVGRHEIPARLRTLLNVESGLNDGLALPVVILLIAVSEHDSPHLAVILGELALGVAFGFVIPWVLLKLEASRWFSAHGRYQPLNVFAIGLVLFAACELTHANAFLAAFTAGATVVAVAPQMQQAFEQFGELVAELVKLAAILVFGALLSVSLFTGIGAAGWALVVVLLVVVRPVALGVALPGKLPRREFMAAAWFGPKGFASVTYGLLVLTSGSPHATQLFELAAVTIAVSIIAHSSTDVVVARWFAGSDDAPEPAGARDG
ncbi:sodium:proton antiporter [Nocardioides sp. GY 10113]|uniref:cation:proton antiporter n=1 Tax=Nocardioides sp. GY 10113 TaxID=2569761 RepID=UPI0010A8A911|nr:cation:proton antiporter [Nocardioides sp. GY 10113]TIC85914.1 sodium:proton antiporter [Nocardioides sp. GY 10113]